MYIALVKSSQGVYSTFDNSTQISVRLTSMFNKFCAISHWFSHYFYWFSPPGE